MTVYLAAILAGLGAGAVYSLMGLGLVVTARGSGLVNFSFGAICAWSSYVYYDLRTNARYPIFLPGPWSAHRFGGDDVRVTVLSAVVLTIATAAVISALAYLLIFRALRSSPLLAKLVASIGVLLALQGMIGIRFDGTSSINLPSTLPGGVLRLTDYLVVEVDALWLSGIAVVVAVALWLLFRYTRQGLAIRASAESEKGAVLLGFAADRLAVSTWVAASMIASVVGILAAPVFQLTPLLFTQLLVPALGAALVGRFVSFGWTVGAGFVIGIVQSLAPALQSDFSWLPTIGLRDGLVFLAVVVALVVMGKRIPERGALDSGRAPAVGDGEIRVRQTIVSVATVVIAFVTLPDAWGLALLTSVIFCGLALSLVVVTGYLGQISLAQMTIAGFAGFVLSRITERIGLPFPIAPLIAAAVASVFGVLVGLPALRVRGVNLAIVTLAGSIAVQEFVFKNSFFVGDLSSGGAPVPRPELFGLNLGLRSDDDPYRPIFGVMVTIVVALVAIGVANIRRSDTGHKFLSVRSNERAAEAIAIDVARTKMLGFAVSAFIAGLMGTFVAYRFGSVSANSYTFFSSLVLLAFAYLGGIASISGAVLAGVFASDGIGFKALDSGWNRLGIEFGRWQIIVGAIGLIVMAVKNPEGLAGTVHGVGRRWAARKGRDR